MNQSKIYDTDLQSLSIRIKGKAICFIIEGKAHWMTLTDRISKKLNDLMIQQNAVEKSAKEQPKNEWPMLTAHSYQYPVIQSNCPLPVYSNQDGWPGPQNEQFVGRHYDDMGK